MTDRSISSIGMTAALNPAVERRIAKPDGLPADAVRDRSHRLEPGGGAVGLDERAGGAGVRIRPARAVPGVLGRGRPLPLRLAPGLGSFRARRDVEDDPGFKQIIPYVIFRSGDAVFTYRRGKQQGESRLHSLRSLGVGGHVAEEDADGQSTLDAYELALRRELDEEVAIGSEGVLSRVGLINDDGNPVGAVHLGVVHVYDLESPSIKPREEGRPTRSSSR